MNQENLVEEAINRLSGYFGDSLAANPPATETSIEHLEQISGGLPREFVIFLSRCDGLRIGREGRDVELHIWGTQEILSAILSPSGPDVPREFLPIRGDPTGERDWLILEEEPIGGAVLRWDPWLPSADLVGSSFGAYLGSWVEYLLRTHTPDGRVRAGTRPRLIFDVRLCGDHDVHLRALRQDARTVARLRDISQAVACGDDYE